MLSRLGKDVVLYGAADLVFRFIGFAVFPVYAHVFSVDDFGIYALVSASVGVVALLANAGLNNAAQRYYWDAAADRAAQPRIVSTGLWTLSAWSAAVTLLFIAASFPFREVLASRYGISETVLLVALLTVIPEQIVQYCLDTTRLHFAPLRFALLALVKNLLGVAVSLVLVVHFRAGLEGLFIGGLAGAAAAIPIALVLVRRDMALAWDRETAAKLASFGYPFIFAGLAYWIFGAADRWMLAEMSSARELGLYAIAYKFGAIALFLNGAFGQAWSPMAMKMRRDDPAYRAAYARVLSIWVMLLLFVGSLLALFGREILRALTPPEYWDAAAVLAILVMGVVVSGTTQITAIGISIEQKTRLFASASWTTAVANVALNALLIPPLGAVGAALATFLSYVLLTALYLFWSQKLHPLPLEKAPLLFAAAVIVAMVAAASFISGLQPSVVVLCAKSAILVLIAAGAVYVGAIDAAAVRNALKESA